MLDRFDYIHLRDITTILPIEPDAWRRTSVLQLAHLTIKIGYPTILLHAAARDDGLDTTLNYSQVYRSVSARIGDHISMQDFMGVPKLAEILLETCVTEVWHCLSSDAAKRIIGKNEIAPLPLELSIRLDKGILRAEKGVTYHFACSHKFADKQTTPQVQLRHVEVSHVKAYCILGVNDCERKARQQVAVTFKLENCQPRLEELQELVEKIGKKIDSSSFFTLEALTSHVCKSAISRWKQGQVTTTVAKPSAIPFVEECIVEMTRTKKDLE